MSHGDLQLNTIEYVKKPDFDKAIATITDAIQELKEDVSSEVRLIVDTQLKQERTERTLAINTMQATLNETISEAVQDTQASMHTIQTEVREFVSLLRERVKTEAEVHRRLDERNVEQDKRITRHSGIMKDLRTNMDNVTSETGILHQRYETLRVTIHGDPTQKSAAPSIYGTLQKLETTTGLIYTVSQQNMQTIVTLETAFKLQAERWQRRQEYWKSILLALFKSKWFWFILVAVIIGSLFGMDMVIALFQTIRF